MSDLTKMCLVCLAGRKLFRHSLYTLLIIFSSVLFYFPFWYIYYFVRIYKERKRERESNGKRREIEKYKGDAQLSQRFCKDIEKEPWPPRRTAWNANEKSGCTCAAPFDCMWRYAFIIILK